VIQHCRNECYAELIASELAELFGINVPVATARTVVDQTTGEITHYVLVTRWVDGVSATEVEAAKLVAMKDQFADHRVFSAIMGDEDRHLGNYLIDAEGRLYTIDSGFGQFTHGIEHFDNEERVAMVMNRPINFAIANINNPDRPWAHGMALLEQSLIRSDLEPAIKRAQTLFQQQRDEIERRVSKALGQLIDNPAELKRATQVAMTEMEERLRALPNVKFDIIGPPIRNAEGEIVRQQTRNGYERFMKLAP
jgi:hypothetical protein